MLTRIGGRDRVGAGPGAPILGRGALDQPGVIAGLPQPQQQPQHVHIAVAGSPLFQILQEAFKWPQTDQRAIKHNTASAAEATAFNKSPVHSTFLQLPPSIVAPQL